MKKTDEGIRAYTQRLQPQLRLLYRAAHAVTGSRSLAECTLSNAVLGAYLHRGEWRERMSFREGVLRAIREEGKEQLRREPEADWDWPGIQPEPDDAHPLVGLLAAESQDAQRAMVLRFACSMPVRDITALTGRKAEEVREELARCQTRAERMLEEKGISAKPFDRYASHELRAWMNRENNEPIDVGYFIATFERDAKGARQPRRVAACIIKWIFFTLGALLLSVCIWLLAVLMER